MIVLHQHDPRKLGQEHWKSNAKATLRGTIENLRSQMHRVQRREVRVWRELGQQNLEKRRWKGQLKLKVRRQQMTIVFQPVWKVCFPGHVAWLRPSSTRCQSQVRKFTSRSFLNSAEQEQLNLHWLLWLQQLLISCRPGWCIRQIGTIVHLSLSSTILKTILTFLGTPRIFAVKRWYGKLHEELQ